MDKIELIKKWITEHVRQQKSIRKSVESYPMKGLVERDIGVYITEEQFITAMKQLGYKHEEYYFNSILISKIKPEQDQGTANKWGLNKHSLTRWKKAQREKIVMP